MAQHTVMPKKLAQALMEAGMKHFDDGGELQPQNTGTGNTGFDTSGANGQVIMDPRNATDPNYNMNNVQNPTDQLHTMGAQAGQGINGLGGIMKDAAGAFTTLNQYQAQAPTIQNQNFQPRIQGLQGQQNQVYSQQQNLAQQLLNQSQGRGPNPAQAQLAQNTGQNVANQSALMASQRGAGSNVGLMARQAALQGANTQQNAIGQAATLGAQQQLQAQNQLSGLYGNLANQSLQGESIQQGGQAAQNTAVTTGQLGAQNINANIAGSNAAALNGTAGGISNALGGGLVNMLYKGGPVQKLADGGIAEYSAPQAAPIQMNDYKNLGLQLNAPKPKEKKPGETKKPTGATNQGQQDSLIAGGPGDAGSLDSQMIMASRGGKIPHFDDGGELENTGNIGTLDDEDSSNSAPTALMGLQNYTPAGGTSQAGGAVANPGFSAAAKGGGGGGGGLGGLMALLAHGGNVPQFNTHLLNGGNVPGKAKVKGDSPKNDVEPTMLSPGEVVLPRSVTQSSDPVGKAAEFMKHLKGGKKGYAKVVDAKKSLKDRVEHLEKLCMGGKR